MPTLSDSTLDTWRRPPSETEEQKISNAITMIKDAVKASEQLNKLDLEFIVQGSYGNDTNIKLDSDIDICVMLKDTFYCKYREGASNQNYGFTDGGHSFSDFRNWINSAMGTKFGYSNITSGNKSIKINSNSYRVHADVVPAFQFRNYRFENQNNSSNFYEGIKFYSLNNEEVINYPKMHIESGKKKNESTSRRYKRTVRLFKKIKNKMKEDNVSVSENISSFLLEGLLWNTPDINFNNPQGWNGILRDCIISLYNNTKDYESCKSWVEPSKMIYLFNSDRKWSVKDVNDFLIQMWNYLEYKP